MCSIKRCRGIDHRKGSYLKVFVYKMIIKTWCFAGKCLNVPCSKRRGAEINWRIKKWYSVNPVSFPPWIFMLNEYLYCCFAGWSSASITHGDILRLHATHEVIGAKQTRNQTVLMVVSCMCSAQCATTAKIGTNVTKLPNRHVLGKGWETYKDCVCVCVRAVVILK